MTAPRSHLLSLQPSAGNAAVARLVAVQREDAESERMQSLQQSGLYERDPLVSSMRNHIIDLYERIAMAPPETYVGNVYDQVLPPSATQANYTAAAGHTARDPVNNRTRWALQSALLQYALVHGYDEMVSRAQGSTEFSYQIHEASFQFAGGNPTIGRLPWALLTAVDVPALGEQIGSVVYGPEAFVTGLAAGLEALAMDPLNTSGADAAFQRGYAQAMAQRHTLGGRLINATIENLNAPGGNLAWWQLGLRYAIDATSWVTTPAYD